MKINKEEEILDLCKDCLIEVNYTSGDIDWCFTCPKCWKHDFTTSWGLVIIKGKKTTLTIETIEIINE